MIWYNAVRYEWQADQSKPLYNNPSKSLQEVDLRLSPLKHVEASTWSLALAESHHLGVALFHHLLEELLLSLLLGLLQLLQSVLGVDFSNARFERSYGWHRQLDCALHRNVEFRARLWIDGD
jgi:hypothetical protein